MTDLQREISRALQPFVPCTTCIYGFESCEACNLIAERMAASVTAVVEAEVQRRLSTYVLTGAKK